MPSRKAKSVAASTSDPDKAGPSTSRGTKRARSVLSIATDEDEEDELLTEAVAFDLPSSFARAQADWDHDNFPVVPVLPPRKGQLLTAAHMSQPLVHTLLRSYTVIKEGLRALAPTAHQIVQEQRPMPDVFQNPLPVHKAAQSMAEMLMDIEKNLGPGMLFYSFYFPI